MSLYNFGNNIYSIEFRESIENVQAFHCKYVIDLNKLSTVL